MATWFLQDEDRADYDDVWSVSDDEDLSPHGNASTREREIRAAWRAKWTRRHERRPEEHEAESRATEQPAWQPTLSDLHMQFDLSPAYFVYSAPARSSAIEQRPREAPSEAQSVRDSHGSFENAEAPNSPRGVEARASDYYKPKRVEASRPGHNLRNELAKDTPLLFDPPVAPRSGRTGSVGGDPYGVVSYEPRGLEFHRPNSLPMEKIRHSSTWPLSLDTIGAPRGPARGRSHRPPGGRSLFSSCCGAADHTGERGL
ncbi:hypothetical protein CTAYLR_003623 [Chrysophaeum taylorii]|uniref:Uncharacterized protein n=1 Tax=Chrysophaeum taylorii TaxID=2483200 RepID=A0AAD7UC08_9STRA|nr:hypothetical protein CTAYLR_003623 [Chrysophaeum taylorii]